MTRIRVRDAVALAAALLYALLWIGWVAGWGWLHSFDQALLNPPHAYGVEHPGWVQGWNVFSTVFGPEVLRGLVLVLIVVELIRRNYRPAVFLLLTAGGSALVTEVAKTLADRPRPETRLVEAHGMSFPSGHAVGDLVIVGGLLVAYLPVIAPRWRTLVIALGAAVVVMIGVSRVVLNVHNPSDVLAGWSLGYLYLLACVRWYPPRPALEAAAAAAPGTVTPAAGTPPAPDTST
ncbi:MAG: phosphatase PAP2 family protein [Mycolicibacterium sp.]|nr:phosphatase PAP2 family protein [Mycolicibacterium sp.]